MEVENKLNGVEIYQLVVFVVGMPAPFRRNFQLFQGEDEVVVQYPEVVDIQDRDNSFYLLSDDF